MKKVPAVNLSTAEQASLLSGGWEFIRHMPKAGCDAYGRMRAGEPEWVSVWPGDRPAQFDRMGPDGFRKVGTIAEVTA